MASDLVERLRHCSQNTRDEYLHELTGRAADRITQQEAVIAGLVGAVNIAIDFLRTAPLESGYCCCGNPVEGHGLGDGHSPVDELSYCANSIEQQLLAALASVKGEQG